MKNLLFIFLLSVVFFSKEIHASPSINTSPSQLPALQELEAKALLRAGLDPAQIKQWQKNVRRAVALPRLQVGYDQKAQIQNTAIVQDNVSVTSAGVTIGPAGNRIDEDFGQDRGFEIKAVWALDELLFNRDELEVSREARDLLFMRSQLIQDLQQTYYELKTQLIRFQLDPKLGEDPIETLKTEQLMDKLNSLTGGEFKKLLKAKNEIISVSNKIKLSGESR